MTVRFFDRRVRFFGNVAALILCAIFFLVPFALRGARMSVERLENNIKDWLPSDFPETKDLEWLNAHFVGERFVLLTWPGCKEGDPSYEMMVSKLPNELVPREPLDTEAEKARQMGDRLGLFAMSRLPAEDESGSERQPHHEYFKNWGGRGEKWLQGDNGWYFITPDGSFYEWDGDSNVKDFVVRKVKKARGQEIATGKKIDQLGSNEPGKPNPYYADPRRLTARYFTSFRSGPMMLRELATKKGDALWPIGTEVADEDKPLAAKRTAYERLAGTLFGPAVPVGFTWEANDFHEQLPGETKEALPLEWEEKFTSFVDRLVEKEYGGDKEALIAASRTRQTRHWDAMFFRLRVAPPPRQTCIIVTLSEPAKRNLSRVLGRPILGKPPGKLFDLAVNECNISYDDLKMGGPPVDNVAIDEEGTVTLVRLVGFSAVIGITLSWLCFRSVYVTMMVFFVGGVSAVSSLALVFWSSAVPGMEGLSSVDAVLMSMPSLVYVLGLSGAVHIVNYYREAAEEQGIDGAAERALAHAWGPCTLAAFTTALGLISLYSSNLMPIKKFGLFSALGVMATLFLLFFYLPSALTIWPFHPKKRKQEDGENRFNLTDRIEGAWLAVGRWIIGHHWQVASACLLVMVGVGVGLRKIETEVQLLKLFDPGAKIIADYHWMETHVGELVPMELVLTFKPEMIRPQLSRELREENPKAYREATFQLSLLERIEAVDRIQKVCEEVFGDEGQGVIGNGMSMTTFVESLPGPTDSSRGTLNRHMERRHSELPDDYVRTDTKDELWRISERLGALNDVDYGEFVDRQKLAVEPILTAYRFRDTILRELDAASEVGSSRSQNVLFLGYPVDRPERDGSIETTSGQNTAAIEAARNAIDQTEIFGETLHTLMRTANCRTQQLHPDVEPAKGLMPLEKLVTIADAVVLLQDHADYDVAALREQSKLFIDARDHQFDLATSKTARQRGDPLQVVYTGVVPVVYKAQRTLLESLVQSMAMAFVMIAGVMMILLRDWQRPIGITNTINPLAGMVSMIPNVFPVVVVFGWMAWRGTKIDIGTMMCASVAMGVAVDDTIHFLTWFRIGMRNGLSRNGAVLEAYRRVATAMTQTTLIGGVGLAVFALSTFTPTQRFGVMMVTLLAAALVGDLVFLPALLAGPLGRFFVVSEKKSRDQPAGDVATTDNDVAGSAQKATGTADSQPGETRHSAALKRHSGVHRPDEGHQWPRH